MWKPYNRSIFLRSYSLQATRATVHDANDTFVAENYTTLKRHQIFSAGVPAELGGGGASYADLCALLRELAHACGSTVLVLAMHTHLLAATVWRWHQGQPVEPLLKRIVSEQLVLITSGASDWLESSGMAQKVDGGDRVTARKVFASGCPIYRTPDPRARSYWVARPGSASRRDAYVRRTAQAS
jgi:alkylation response protein AidB-like acyl-CoA dehydrogenase